MASRVILSLAALLSSGAALAQPAPTGGERTLPGTGIQASSIDPAWAVDEARVREGATHVDVLSREGARGPLQVSVSTSLEHGCQRMMTALADGVTETTRPEWAPIPFEAAFLPPEGEARTLALCADAGPVRLVLRVPHDPAIDPDDAAALTGLLQALLAGSKTREQRISLGSLETELRLPAGVVEWKLGNKDTLHLVRPSGAPLNVRLIYRKGLICNEVRSELVKNQGWLITKQPQALRTPWAPWALHLPEKKGRPTQACADVSGGVLLAIAARPDSTSGDPLAALIPLGFERIFEQLVTELERRNAKLRLEVLDIEIPRPKDSTPWLARTVKQDGELLDELVRGGLIPITIRVWSVGYAHDTEKSRVECTTARLNVRHDRKYRHASSYGAGLLFTENPRNGRTVATACATDKVALQISSDWSDLGDEPVAAPIRTVLKLLIPELKKIPYSGPRKSTQPSGGSKPKAAGP